MNTITCNNAAGNLTTDAQGNTYEYDYENRIVKITEGQTDIAEYSYDALGRRVEKKDCITSGNTRRYYYDKDWRVVDDYDGSGTLKRRYMCGNYIDEVLFSWLAPGATYRYYVHDHLYSAVAILGYDSSVLERYEAACPDMFLVGNAYGEPNILDGSYIPRSPQASTCDNSYLFTGRQVDILDGGALKIQYNRNRYYDYYTGRWTTQDPLGMNPLHVTDGAFKVKRQYTDGLSLYLYALMDPQRYSDPRGLLGRCGECTPPPADQRNAYRSRIVGWGHTAGIGSPSVSENMKRGIELIDHIALVGGIAGGPAEAIDAIRGAVLTDIIMSQIDRIEAELPLSDMRRGWYVWALVEYETCKPCGFLCSSTLNPFVWGCERYHYKKVQKWHPCDAGTPFGTVDPRGSGPEKVEQIRTARRSCRESASTRPDDPPKINGPGLETSPLSECF